MSYVQKMGASALVVAAAFAVAFAVLLSSAPRTAEAGNPDTAANVHVGDVITITSDATSETDTVTFGLADDAVIGGVFVHSETGTIACAPDRVDDDGNLIDSSCDVGPTEDTDTNTDGIQLASEVAVTVEFRLGATGTTNGGTLDNTAFTPANSVVDVDPGNAVTTGTAFTHTHNVDGNAGETVTVTFDLSVAGGHNVAAGSQPAVGTAGPGDGNFYRISDSSIGSGSFVSNGQSSVDCADSTKGTGCDTDKDANEVGLQIAIAADSAKGKIIVERYERNRGADPDFRDAIEINVVSVAAPVATLSLKAAEQSIAAAGGTTTLTVEMKKGNGDPASGQSVTLIANRGVFGNGNQLEKVTTNANGVATATFRGAQVGGEATVTATSGDLSQTVSISLHSGPDSLGLALDDLTLQAEGANTFVVVTVMDKDGNAVGSQSPTATIKGPNALATLVVADASVDRDLPGTANDIPACSTGTDKDGQCVISVTAPKGATAGAHTVNVTLARLPKAALKESVNVEVVGKPASLTIAAPETVEPLGEADITITIYDEAGNLAAANEVTVRKIEGDGLIEPSSKTTKNGVAAFTFYAPTGGDVVFTAEVGTGANRVRELHTITVGEAAPAEPEAASLDRTPASTGYTLVNFSGGSVAELDAALADACGSSAAAYATNLGEYVGYLVGAPAVVNRAFNDLFADGIPANTPLLVGGCGS